jgi:hypothetical protein
MAILAKRLILFLLKSFPLSLLFSLILILISNILISKAVPNLSFNANNYKIS